jgi:hypothetical protein
MYGWETRYRCVFCHRVLTIDQRYCNDGRCPKCGKKHKDVCMIAKCYEEVVRFVVTYKPPWWKFWEGERGYWEVMKDDD